MDRGSSARHVGHHWLISRTGVTEMEIEHALLGSPAQPWNKYNNEWMTLGPPSSQTRSGLLWSSRLECFHKLFAIKRQVYF